MKMNLIQICRVLVVLAFASLANRASADVTKADNTLDLTNGTSWAGGLAPTSSDLMIINSTLTVPRTANLGGDLSVLGITNSSANTLTSGSTSGKTLTIGASGITESAAEAIFL
ncbi:MAG: hypothetical protein NTY53_20540 [Kiritimatiellaeota bacterium]|nr:hypothetical protein [Kiritimatiellota bacterium]